MRRLIFIGLCIFGYIAAMPQSHGYKANYEAFKKKAEKEYNDFRDRANKEYADFVRKAWAEYGSSDPIPMPIEEQIPPVVIDDDQKDREPEDTPIVIEEVIDVPAPAPQPTPVAPIEEQPAPIDDKFSFVFYGTPVAVRLTDDHKFKLKNLQPETIAKQWEKLSAPKYNNVINDCLKARTKYKLCDWAYLRMLAKLSEAFLGEGTNEAELLKAFIYCQSGYQMRLGIGDGRLCMLYASDHVIFDRSGWLVDGTHYYLDDRNIQQLNICAASYPHERAMSLYITDDMDLDVNVTPERAIHALSSKGVRVSMTENQNLMDFCNDYPPSYIGDDIMTRWAIYANMPLSANAKKQLYPQLEKKLSEIADTYKDDGESKVLSKSVDAICNWVQTGFVYEYDDKVWGRDRAFFADETLFYPYCDCEDRSILLTRIVRDLLGLDCALVYYPGHLATAIAIGEDVKGDFIRIDGKKFLVCDPTYINAPIGMTMPGMDNAAAKVLVLK